LCADPRSLTIDGPYDVAIVDGGPDRLRGAAKSLSVLTDDGALILDNSEGFWGPEEAGRYPIIELMYKEEFSRVDFYGYPPGCVRPSCTSLFFRAGCFLLKGEKPPLRRHF
jgi:hypothetical protein